MHGRYHRNSSYPPPKKKEPSQKPTGTLDHTPPPPEEGEGVHVLKTNIKQQIGRKTNITQYILYSLHN